MKTIDLRSDTITRPTPAMREAMARAEVGDDVFGEDPTVNLLQDRVAEILGKEAALYVPSGTMGNQTCMKVHTRPGDEVVAERGSHVFNYETGGAAFLSGVQLHIIDGVRGAITADQIKRVIRPRVYYMSRTSLVCLENTHNRAGGTVYPLDMIREIKDLAAAEGIRMHLDGARLWNACAATGRTPAEYASLFDSVSVCFSKGLGAPVGSAIAGSREFIAEARRYRKIFGGGMRQAGILAAACLYALDHNVTRLTEDHEKATLLAREIAQIPGIEVDLEGVHTNIVIAGVERLGRSVEEVLALLRERGVLLTPGNWQSVRAVTHLDVTLEDVRRAAAIVRETLGEK
jgi:threonine aldolase